MRTKPPRMDLQKMEEEVRRVAEKRRQRLRVWVQKFFWTEEDAQMATLWKDKGGIGVGTGDVSSGQGVDVGGAASMAGMVGNGLMATGSTSDLLDTKSNEQKKMLSRLIDRQDKEREAFFEFSFCQEGSISDLWNTKFNEQKKMLSHFMYRQDKEREAFFEYSFCQEVRAQSIVSRVSRGSKGVCPEDRKERVRERTIERSNSCSIQF